MQAWETNERKYLKKCKEYWGKHLHISVLIRLGQGQTYKAKETLVLKCKKPLFTHGFII